MASATHLIKDFEKEWDSDGRLTSCGTEDPRQWTWKKRLVTCQRCKRTDGYRELE